MALLALGCGCMGGHVQAGPTIGYSFNRGTTLGWEAGGGALGLVRASTGGSYSLEPAREPEPLQREASRPADADASEPRAGRRPSGVDTAAEGDDGPSPDAVHYLALEPLGLSVGVAFPSIGKPGFMGGVWLGWVLDPNARGVFGYDEEPDRLKPEIDCIASRLEPGFLLSGALGIRYMAGEWEAYFTPKAVVLWCLEYGS